jgi:hypothetical protein
MSNDPRDLIVFRRLRIHQFLWPSPEESLRRVSLRNLLLVGDSVGESVDDLLGEGKRSRYTLSPGGEDESADWGLALESEEVRPRAPVST